VQSTPDFTAANLLEAVNIIIRDIQSRVKS